MTSLMTPDVRAKPHRNLFRYPGMTNGNAFGYWGGSSPNTISSATTLASSWSLSGWVNRITWSARSVASGDIGTQLSEFSHPGLIAEIIGRRVTLAFDMRTSHPITVSGSATANLSGTGTITTNSWGVTGQCGPTQTARFWLTFTLSAGVTGVGSLRANLSRLPLEAGVWAEISNVDLYFGDYDPNRILGYGDLPGWTWLGTPWASESVGWPYTLESIAGIPVGINLQPSPASGTASSESPALAPLQGRTLYTVYNVIDNVASYPLISIWNKSGEGSLRTQHTVANGNATGLRVDTIGLSGGSNMTTSIANVRTVGRHLAAVIVNDGMTLSKLWVDAFNVSRVLSPGDGMPWSGPAIISHQVGGGAIASYGYGQAHNDETARRVMAWLARRYGGPIPAGY